MIIREKQTKPDLILTADWHLREDTPICRTDDFLKAQWEKVDFVSELQQEYDCPVFHAGDLFHHWKPSPFLLSETIAHIPNSFSTIYGNHDLPQHNLELANKSGIYTLERAKVLSIPTCMGGWGLTPEHWIKYEKAKIKGRSYFVWHTMTYPLGKEPYPNCPTPHSAKLLKKYSDYDLIVTGDNHHSFVTEYEGRLLVNPGSLTRQTADQINHQPCVYLWYAKTNTVETVYLPIEKDVISREHIEHKEERDKRIQAFVSKLNDEWEASVNFEDNLKQFEQQNSIRQPVMEIIYRSIDIH